MFMQLKLGVIDGEPDIRDRACFERYLGNPLQRVNCLLCINEFPFKASIVLCIGNQGGTISFTQGPSEKFFLPLS